MNIETLIEKLRQPGARLGIGVWLMPREYIGQEETIAARLDIQALDARQAYLDSLPAEAKFSGLTQPDGHQRLVRVLRDLTQSIQTRDCLLVHTLDLLLLGLAVNERTRFWEETLPLPYPQIKLILTIPDQASILFSADMQRRYAAQIAEGPLV